MKTATTSRTADLAKPHGAGPCISGLDTLRALAIVAVMVYHLSYLLPPCFEVVSHFGWMAVDLFFVLSGYLIGSQLLRPVSQGRGVSLWAFYRRRAYRILPAYLVVLAVYAVWPGGHEAAHMSPWWQFLTFTENLFVDYSRNHAFSHIWSLCVEEHFYLLLPLIVSAMARRPSLCKTAALLVGLVLFGMAVRWYELAHVLRPLAAAGHDFGARYVERIYYPTYSRLDGLLVGVALALIKIFRPAWWAALGERANLLLAAGLAMVGCAIWLFYNRFDSLTGVAAAGTLIGFPVLSLGLALWIPGATSPGCWLGRARFPGARLVATLSFSLYLTHKEAAHIVSRRLPALTASRGWVCVPVYAISCLAVAAVLYLAVERPMLALRDRRDRSKGYVDAQARIDPAL